MEEWSPDSKELIYTTNLSDSTSNFYTNSKVFIVKLADKTSRQVAIDFDEDLGGGFNWKSSGIYFTVFNKTKRPIYKLDPGTGIVSVFMNTPDQIYGLSFAKLADKFAFTGRNGDELNEVYVSPFASPAPKKITEMTSQLSSWKLGTSEVISWKKQGWCNH